MARRASTLPVRIYSYGCRLPTRNGDFVEQQLLLAHRYYNKLIEIVRRERAKVREARTALVPDVAEAEAKLASLNTEIEAVYTAIKAKRAVARSKKVDAAEERARLGVLRAERTAVVEVLRAAKTAAHSPELLKRWRVIHEEAAQEKNAARAVCGLHWGTYLIVEQAVGAAVASKSGKKLAEARARALARGRVGTIDPDPEFHHWTGHNRGRVGVHFQGGIPIAEIFSGSNPRLQIDPLPTEGSKRGRLMTKVRIRVGRDEPLMAEFPFRMHRPLPADGRVTWAWIFKSYKGRWVNWDLQIVVESASFVCTPRPPSDGGVVAIDVGWRVRPTKDGTADLRSAYWVNDQGEHGELTVPADIRERLDHANSLQAIQDRIFNEARAQLAIWLAGQISMPAWLSAAVKHMAKWRSPRHLGEVVDRWKGERFEGDEEIFETMRAWWKQHRHLYDWESCERDRTLGARNMLYRRWAAAFTRRYAVVVLEDFDKRNTAELEAPDSNKADLPAAVRYNRTVAACSELVLALKSAAPGRGCTIKTFPAAYTTATCAACGHVQIFDHRPLEHRCERCGDVTGLVDQDRNAAENLLALWTAEASRSQDAEKPLADSEVSEEAVKIPTQEDGS